MSSVLYSQNHGDSYLSNAISDAKVGCQSDLFRATYTMMWCLPTNQIYSFWYRIDNRKKLITCECCICVFTC